VPWYGVTTTTLIYNKGRPSKARTGHGDGFFKSRSFKQYTTYRSDALVVYLCPNNNKSEPQAQQQAEWKLLVDLTGGQAARVNTKRQRKSLGSVLSNASKVVSDSWRKHESSQPGWGDYRNARTVTAAATAAADALLVMPLH
jgi:hypothetical protein